MEFLYANPGLASKYNRSDLRGDLMAGLTVAVMLVPQGMAYGLLAGLSPIYGLYAGIVPLLLYAFFGTSRQLSVGPVALVSLLILSGVGKYAEPGSELFISMAITTALIAGLIQILPGGHQVGLFNQFSFSSCYFGLYHGCGNHYWPEPVEESLWIDLPRSNQVHVVLTSLLNRIHETNLPTLLIGTGGIALIFLLKRINKALPGALITVIIGTVLVWIMGLDQQGVATVGRRGRWLAGFGHSNPNLGEHKSTAAAGCYHLSDQFY